MKMNKRIVTDFIGAFGDIGTFLPIVCGLIMVNKVSATNLFISAGLFYIFTGLYFRIPVPVQPLKATSALAIALGSSASTVSFVAFFMAAFLFIIVLFNLDRFLARLFSRPVIRGIQLGLAVILIKSSLRLIFGPHTLNLNHALVPDGSLNLYQAFFILFLPQIPLTLGNSVYASSDTAQTYFKERAFRVTPSVLILSLGIGNLISGCFGAIPFCHGSSGITAHYRFGGRTGLCTVFAGIVCFFIAVAFMFGAGNVLTSIPSWVLGVALAYIGVRHAALISDTIRAPRELIIVLFIGIYTLFFGNLAAAFLIVIALQTAVRAIFRSTYEKTCHC